MTSYRPHEVVDSFGDGFHDGFFHLGDSTVDLPVLEDVKGPRVHVTRDAIESTSRERSVVQFDRVVSLLRRDDGDRVLVPEEESFPVRDDEVWSPATLERGRSDDDAALGVGHLRVLAEVGEVLVPPIVATVVVVTVPLLDRIEAHQAGDLCSGHVFGNSPVAVDTTDEISVLES